MLVWPSCFELINLSTDQNIQIQSNALYSSLHVYLHCWLYSEWFLLTAVSWRLLDDFPIVNISQWVQHKQTSKHYIYNRQVSIKFVLSAENCDFFQRICLRCASMKSREVLRMVNEESKGSIIWEREQWENSRANAIDVVGRRTL